MAIVVRKQAYFQIAVVAILFIVAAAWYFFPLRNDTSLIFRMRLALPAALLAAGGIGLLPRQITVAFVFCTMGDAMGVAGSFEAQMGVFAVAQICFIKQFAREVRQYCWRNVPPSAYIAANMVCLMPLLLFVLSILRNVRPISVKIGCVVYGILLLLSLRMSIIRAISLKRYLAMIGCIMFVISDFTIAWNKFMNHIPHASLFIMATYYAALILIFSGELRLKRVEN